MSDARTPSLLARLTRTRRAAALRPDPADMGTAFGLDYMLDQERAAAQARADHAPTESHWLGRWLTGKPGT
jgi:hypothetical protein